MLWPVCLCEGIPHGLDLLEVARHICGHHHLYHQSPQLPANNQCTQLRSSVINCQAMAEPFAFQICIYCIQVSTHEWVGSFCVCTSSRPCSGWSGCSSPPLPSACRRRWHDGSPALTCHCTEWPPPTWRTDTGGSTTACLYCSGSILLRNRFNLEPTPHNDLLEQTRPSTTR